MVPDINIWDREKEPGHLRNHLYAGRIFCFEFDKSTYCFGRIISKTLVGHIAEIFSHTSPLPEISADIILSAKRIGVFVLDTENLFMRNTKHNFRIIGDQRNFCSEDVDDIEFRLGSENKKVDFFGKISVISEAETDKLPPFFPLDEDELKTAIAPIIGKEFVPAKAKKKSRELEIWGWDKKPRTMLRALEAGQIFCFKYDEKKFCFGRLMTKCCVGHIAEFFNYISDAPAITAEILSSCKRVSVQIIDSYSLFDRKTEGEWRIIGKRGNYIPSDVADIKFYMGIGSDLRIVDYFDHETKASAEEAKKYPPLSPHGDYQIKTELSKIISDKRRS